MGVKTSDLFCYLLLHLHILYYKNGFIMQKQAYFLLHCIHHFVHTSKYIESTKLYFSSYCTYLGIFLTMSIKLYPWPWGIRVLNLFTRIMHTVEWTIFLYINNHWRNVPGLSVLFSRFTILYKKNWLDNKCR